MSYSDTENEHHEAISTGIVALRNEVAKLTASAHNMRGQGLACEDADRARALYESSAAYADAAQRVGTVVNDFEQAESYRAGAMEAIGPVLSYDELGNRLARAELAVTGANNRVEFLENLISGLDADLGGEPRATTEEVLQAAARAAHNARRFQGIRDSAVNLLDKVGGQYSVHTLVDLLTILLDGDEQETLKKFKAATGVDRPVLNLPKISPELSAQIRRLGGSLMDPFKGALPERFEPSVDQLVTGHDVLDMNRPATVHVGDLITGRVTFVDADFVTVQLAKYRSGRGWYLTHVSLDRTELRPSLPHEVDAFTRNLQLAKDDNPGLLPDDVSVETDGDAPEPDRWTPEPGDVVIVTSTLDEETMTAQYVGPYGPGDQLASVVQVPEEAPASDGHVWAKRKVDTAQLAKAAPHQVGEFLQELEAKGLDSVIR